MTTFGIVKAVNNIAACAIQINAEITLKFEISCWEEAS